MSDNWGNSFALDSPEAGKNKNGISNKILVESDRQTKDDVMKEIEEFVKPRRNKKGPYNEGDDVYDMCD